MVRLTSQNSGPLWRDVVTQLLSVLHRQTARDSLRAACLVFLTKLIILSPSHTGSEMQAYFRLLLVLSLPPSLSLPVVTWRLRHAALSSLCVYVSVFHHDTVQSPTHSSPCPHAISLAAIFSSPSSVTSVVAAGACPVCLAREVCHASLLPFLRDANHGGELRENGGELSQDVEVSVMALKGLGMLLYGGESTWLRRRDVLAHEAFTYVALNIVHPSPSHFAHCLSFPLPRCPNQYPFSFVVHPCHSFSVITFVLSLPCCVLILGLCHLPPSTSLHECCESEHHHR